MGQPIFHWELCKHSPWLRVLDQQPVKDEFARWRLCTLGTFAMGTVPGHGLLWYNKLAVELMLLVSRLSL